MDELYSIMKEFLEVEYNLESLVCLLGAMENDNTDESQIDAKLIANSTRFYLKGLQKEMRTAINGLDLYIAESAKNNNKGTGSDIREIK